MASPTRSPKKPTTTSSPSPSASPSRTERSPAPVFPVPVRTGDATQVITVEASGSYAKVTAWAKEDGRWRVAGGPWQGRVGENGIVPGSERKQGSGTTPAGTYTMTEAFGIASDPGTALPYLKVGEDDWWVGDNNSKYYNDHRRGSQGGFDTSLPESHVNGSERLITHTRAYQYAVVIDFNRWPAVRYRGAAIFLHVNGSGATAGCVSIPKSAMVEVLRWLKPSAHPRIAIG
jgi:L,D-peptidoglycan transpeptidase YkuD (ErfK/YbiS/YcfS/YnhG family)